MVKKVDELMYKVKQNGKNNVEYQIYPDKKKAEKIRANCI